MAWFDPSDFYDLASGRRKGIKASLLRTGLALIEPLYGLGVAVRNRRYDRGAVEVCPIDVPVVSVGNLTTGGTGKTPMVAWIARRLRDENVRVTLVSRGYGAQHEAKNDEALEMELRLPDVPHLQNPDRVEAAEMAIEEFAAQCIVLDDAFQHRRIDRDLDIVLLDALSPFGYNHLLPRGTLREPVAGLRRADVIALSRADMISADERAAIRQVALRHAPGALWMECRHRPAKLISTDGAEHCRDGGAEQPAKVAAFCGIGNPSGFRHSLESFGLTVAGFRTFPDHHPYHRNDIASLNQWAAEHKHAETIICTHKDLVKIRLDELGGKPLFALTVELEIMEGEQELQDILADIIEEARAHD